MDDDGTSITLSAFCRPPPPRRRRTDGGDSNRFSEEGNSSISSIDSLPNELLFDILLLLPADFLHEKARLVCRKWHEIIRSDDFINVHVRISRSCSGLLLTSKSSIPHTDHIHITAIKGRIQTQELIKTRKTKTLSSCNGLVMEMELGYYDVEEEDEEDEEDVCSILVTNPTTSKQPFRLPPPPLPAKGDDDQTLFFRGGIAYSAASMAYKLIAVPYYVRGGVLTLPKPTRLHILTAGVDKSWRNLELGHLTEDVRSLLRWFPSTTEGFLHWRMRKEVLSLNVETETFTFTEIPESYPYIFYYDLPAGSYLSVLCIRENHVWEIWEMNPEGSGDDRWRSLLPLKIDLRPLKRKLRRFASRRHELLTPLGWVKYLEVLALFFLHGRTCIFYNLHTHEIDTIELPQCVKFYRGFTHRNTLVRLS